MQSRSISRDYVSPSKNSIPTPRYAISEIAMKSDPLTPSPTGAREPRASILSVNLPNLTSRFCLGSKNCHFFATIRTFCGKKFWTPFVSVAGPGMKLKLSVIILAETYCPGYHQSPSETLRKRRFGDILVRW